MAKFTPKQISSSGRGEINIYKMDFLGGSK
jgi:hypothetical protein